MAKRKYKGSFGKWGKGEETYGGWTTDPETGGRLAYGETYEEVAKKKKERIKGETPPKKEEVKAEEKPRILTDPKTGEVTGVEIGGRTFLGLKPEDVESILAGERPRAGPETAAIQAGMEQERKIKGAIEPLSEKFGEARVFEEPVLKPIISQDMENAGVLIDMALALVPEGKGLIEMMTGKDPIHNLKGREAMGLAEERVTETELAMQDYVVNNTLSSEIGKQFDEEIEVEMTQMGIGVGMVVGSVIGGFMGSAMQLVGTDKKVKNLATGVINLETIGTKIAAAVVKGDIGTDEGLRRINYIMDIIDNLEAELQLAAIESANVRISLKGREISTKIFKARTTMQTSLSNIAGFEVAGLISDSPAHQKASILSDMKEAWKRKQ